VSPLTPGYTSVLVIVSVNLLVDGRVEVRVSKPQFDSRPAQGYPEARASPVRFWDQPRSGRFSLDIASQMDANEQLKFPPMDVPRHELLSNGFRL
jgi:hypothetical protein